MSDSFFLGAMSQRHDGEGLVLGFNVGRWQFRVACLFGTERYLEEDGENDPYFTGLLTVGLRLVP